MHSGEPAAGHGSTDVQMPDGTQDEAAASEMWWAIGGDHVTEGLRIPWGAGPLPPRQKMRITKRVSRVYTIFAY